MKKLTELTPEQHARMASFAQEWIQHGWRTKPLTEEEWQVVEDGMRRCYEYAGIAWPGVVVRVPSPIVGAFAAPTAQFAIELRRRLAVGGAVGGAVRGAVGDAVDGAVDGAVGGAVDGAVRDAVGGAVDGAVRGAVGGAVDGAVDGAVGDAVDGAVDGAVGDAVGGAVDGAVGGAVDGAVRGAVRDAVDGAVRGAVRDAVERVISRRWYYRLGGRLWPTWQAYVAFFRDVVELDINSEIWDRSRAYDDAQAAGWWWPFRDFVMVCEPPTEIHVEQVGPTGWGSHRLHCETGPAVSWSDGWGVYSWRGTNVPAWVIESPTVAKAMSERNSEIRRCAFESIGWGQVLQEIDVEPIDTCPDPANAPHELKLYPLPDDVNPYGQPVNLLLMTNGSPDRNGVLRQYGETVPATITKADAAAGWQYGLNPSVYRQLERRT